MAGHPAHGVGVVVVDLGVKRNIMRILKRRGCDVTAVPHQTTAEEILSMNPAGVLLSPGPGDPRILGEAMRFCGQGAFLMGLVADARRDLEAARDLHRQVGHKRGEAIVTSNLASACWLLGDVDRAKELFEEARLAHRDHGDRRQELTVELNLTLIEGLSGLPRRELRRLQESSRRVTEALRRQGDRPLLAGGGSGR